MGDNNEWIEATRKKVNYMTNVIWDGITELDVQCFLGNFKPDHEIVGWVLLDMLVYYSNEQEESIISNLIRLLERDIWITSGMAKKNLSSQQIRSNFEDIYKNMCFVPVAESDMSASSLALTSQFKKNRNISKYIKYVELWDFPIMLAMQNKYFVFYDDLVGTGTQFDTFWNNKQFGTDKSYSLKDLVKSNKDRHFYYLVLGGCQDGLEKLEEEIDNLTIIVSEFFPRYADIFDSQNEYWELNPDKKDIVLDYIRDKESELNLHNSFSKNIPVLFQHGRSSNTALSLYWMKKTNVWNGLYRR